jgi:hypothetical protein
MYKLEDFQAFYTDVIIVVNLSDILYDIMLNYTKGTKKQRNANLIKIINWHYLINYTSFLLILNLLLFGVYNTL